jgi:hypothetical protein
MGAADISESTKSRVCKFWSNLFLSMERNNGFQAPKSQNLLFQRNGSIFRMAVDANTDRVGDDRVNSVISQTSQVGSAAASLHGFAANSGTGGLGTLT